MQIRIYNTGYEKCQLVTSYMKQGRDNNNLDKDIKRTPECQYFFCGYKGGTIVKKNILYWRSLFYVIATLHCS
jgi:hypothetical protein